MTANRPTPIVAIVGRPNVGMSSLFNRIVGQRRAIVDATPGVTRDPVYAQTDWNGRELVCVDTGGIAEGGIELADEVREQALAAMAGADAVLLVVDASAGLHPLDRDVAELLRRAGKPLVLVANKVDNPGREQVAAEFYRLGLGEPMPVSAVHGLGIGDLLDRVLSLLPKPEEAKPEGREEGAIARVAVVGRPNVGKSSLINRLVGEKRCLVSELPGTTRDTVDVVLHRERKRYLLVDTAGIRRPGRLAAGLERYTVLRSLRAIDRAEVAVLVIDASLGVVHQDQRLASYIQEAGRALIVALNKWDLVPGEEAQKTRQQAVAALSFVAHAPIWVVSARTGRGVEALLQQIDRVVENYRRRASDSALARVLEDATSRVPPPERLRLGPIRQVAVGPPAIIIEVRDPARVPGSYRRYVEARLREAFPWEGVPLRLLWRERRKGVSTRGGTGI